MKNANKHPLKDYAINIKLQLAALWASVMLCYIYCDYFELYAPNKLSSMLEGNSILDSPIKLLLAAVMMSFPALMIFLSIALKPKLNRWLNIGIGAFFTLTMVLILISSLTAWYSFYLFMGSLEVTLTLIIVWKAIKWPRED